MTCCLQKLLRQPQPQICPVLQTAEFIIIIYPLQLLLRQTSMQHILRITGHQIDVLLFLGQQIG